VFLSEQLYFGLVASLAPNRHPGGGGGSFYTFPADGGIPWQQQTEIVEEFIQLSQGNLLQASLTWKNFYFGVSY
jgi:hypothetical protein